ncbi:protein of unknown function DUF4451 [Metschnikowia aff. pulcherrima]|uniref:Transcription regulator Rua1 C-terminal domain-containing protein n=1 Tax=Metschnikowia aff. pulcherrima TaxID=2163413 RepID=A0A4P6XFF3_9ASCO|nr:protein of unknown function DUF4451 [Metschnikowia aff. pulcherrima]
MVTMGSMSEFGLLEGGQDFMMQGSYATDAAQVSHEDVFRQVDVPFGSDSGDTAKETEDDIYDWIFEEGPVDDNDEEESAGLDAENSVGMEIFAEPNPLARASELETTVDPSGDFFGSFSFTDMDVEAEIPQPQEPMMAFEGANVFEAAPSFLVNTSLASFSVENFSELLPVASSHDANLDQDFLQFAVSAQSDASTEYSNPQPALVEELNEDKLFDDLISKEFDALAYQQELFDLNFAPKNDAFGGAITHVLAGNKLRVNTSGQLLDTIYEMAEDVVESNAEIFEQSDSSFNEPSDLSLVYPNTISFDKMFQTETMAAVLGVGFSPDESMLDDEPEYIHTAACGGDAEDLVPAFDTENNAQYLFSVPRSFEGDFLSKNPVESAGFDVKIRQLAGLNKGLNLDELIGQQACINTQTAIKAAVAKGRKKGPQSPRIPTASASSSASLSTARVTKPLGAKPKKPRRVKRMFDYSQANVNTIEVPCPELQKIMVTRAELIEVCGDQFDWEKAKEGEINRRRFVRGSLDGLAGLHPNVAYEKNPLFGLSRPYQQEFTRVELDPTTGVPIMETRSGLCCYCEDLHFYELKNSCYSQHMSHSHGVYTDNSLAPDAIIPGDYNLSKKFTPGRKTIPHARDRPGVVCPACLDVVEIRCWKSTLEKKPLSNYLRHFKDQHRVESNKDTFVDLQAGG